MFSLSKDLGEIKRLDSRAVWKSESRDFTPWLRDNIQRLSEAIGLEIDLVEREVPVGSFTVDLFGKDLNSNRDVVIENQIGPTDHTHLGQLMTYAANLEAGIVIWISTEFRQEHQKVLDWLNKLKDPQHASFFGIQLELLQIDDSKPAPNFKVVAYPTEWPPETPPETTKKQQAYLEFFTKLLQELKSRNPRITSAKKAYAQNWFSFGAGKSGFSYSFSFTLDDRFRVELYIDTGSKEKNQLAFENLRKQKDDIEKQLGYPLEWEELPNARACRIAIYKHGNIFSSEEELASLRSWGIDRILEIRNVFSKRILKKI